MAFFGLTALGPQNCFQVSLLDFSYLDVFTDVDMENAFNRVDQQKRGFLHPEQVEEFLSELYHGKPKACDLARFTEKMKTFFADYGEEETSRVTLGDIRSTMTQLKKEVRRHEYIARGPRERYARTVTAVQEHGWQDQLEINKQVVHGKKSCAETVYASELVKSGVYF
eukprot:g9496.t1